MIDSELDLVEALASGDFARLLGTPESDWLDFKQEPYSFDPSKPTRLTARGKWNLAKHVAAFANAQGGFIVLGVGTERHTHEIVEAASRIHPIEKVLIDPTSYIDVVKSWIYPRVRGMRLRWFPNDASESHGLFVIHVRPQQPQDQYFIVRRMLDENDRETGAIGIPVREGDRSEWLPAETVHRLIRRGLDSGVSAERQRQESTPTLPTERVEERLDEIERIENWAELGIYALQAIPPPGRDLLDRFYDREGIRGALERPASLRQYGFNLEPAGPAEVVEGSLVLRRPGDFVVWVEPSGFFTAVVCADADFLGWAVSGRDWKPGMPLRVNPIVLVEFTLEVLRLVDAVLAPASAGGSWQCRVRSRRFKTNDVRLGPGRYRRFPPGFLGGDHPASSDDWTREFQGERDPGRDAFLALERVYALWGLGADAIPFVEDGRVSEALLLEVDATG